MKDLNELKVESISFENLRNTYGGSMVLAHAIIEVFFGVCINECAHK